MVRLMRLTSIALVFIIFFSCMQIAVVATAINNVYSADAQAEAVRSLTVGDHVTMGKWEQDNKTNNGQEAIDWRVLAIDDNRALLITEKGIDVISYDDDRDAVHRNDLNWETSSIRKWLNGTFYSSAFTKEEKERIMLSSVYVNDAYGEFTTDDLVFCLSEEETRRYFSNNVDMACQPTAYAKTKIKKNGSLDTAQYGIWWLRDMASSYRSSSAFNFMETEYNESSYVFQQQGIKPYRQSEMWIIPYLADSVLVRPAMWIVLDTAKKETTQEPPLQHGNQVQAGNIDTSDYEYQLLADGTIEITKYDGRASRLVVPSEIDGKKVTQIGESAFDSCEMLTVITLPDGVTSIGTKAFYFCDSLAEITLPDSLLSIGTEAFYHCVSLTEITLPDGLISIGDEAFRSCLSLACVSLPDSLTQIGANPFVYCSVLNLIQVSPNHSTLSVIDGVLFNKSRNSLVCYPKSLPNSAYTIPQGITSIDDGAFMGCQLASIMLPDSVTSIGKSAFESCSSLSGITLPNSVTSIDDRAFFSCTSLSSITLPDSVVSIGNEAFCACYSLNSIILSDSLTSIGDEAFAYSRSLTSIVLPDNITSIGANPFRNCDSLNQIQVSPKHSTLSVVDGVLFNKSQKTLICYPSSLQGTKYTVPQGIEHIGDYAFSDCNTLTAISLPNSVTSIGKSAFEYCESISSITLPNSVTSIGNSAFSSCKSLSSITLPNSVTSIGNSAFSSCESLSSITLPNSVTNIGAWTFCYCHYLKSITLPNSVTSIGSSAFEYCISLKNITMPSSLTSIGENAFKNCSALTSIIIPNSVTTIGSGAFDSCTELLSVTIPDSTINIGANPFRECQKLKQIQISPEHPTLAIMDGVLFNKVDKELICYPNYLKNSNYAVPKGIKSIGSYAFYKCMSLTSITLPNSVISIGDNAFLHCESLTDITLPNSVMRIGDYAFMFCKSLRSITLPDNLKGIGRSTFDCCESLRSVLFPSNLESIGSHAFCYCSSLTNIKLPNTVRVIGYQAFVSCSSLTSITLPNGLTNMGDLVFAGCKKLTSVSFPDSLIWVSSNPFSNCPSLREIKISPTHPALALIDGVLINTVEKQLIYHPSFLGRKEYSVPDGIILIDDYAFSDCKDLTKITIPASVRCIYNHAFPDVPNFSLIVERDSYAAQFAKKYGYSYVYPDSNDWLNN